MKDCSIRRLTMVVPTYNRPQFLLRLLTYASETSLPSRIVVMDSSDPGDQAKNEAMAGCFRGRLDLKYRHVRTSLLEKLWLGVDMAESEYVCFWADDDLQVAAGLESCVEFLEVNPDYASCTAGFLSIRTRRQPELISITTHPIRNEPDPTVRLANWSKSSYSTFYSVYRRQVLSKCLTVTKTSSSYESCRIIPEIQLGQLSVLLGLQGSTSAVSIVYQMHPANDSRTIPAVKNHSTFEADYNRYRAGMVQLLGTEFGVVEANAAQVIDQSFSKVYRWTGGRGWLLKKLRENIRRIWNRSAAKLFEHGKATDVPMTRRIELDDPVMTDSGVRCAIDWIRKYPAGILDQ
jgi:glycosyltransferase domain-containing protein